MMQQLPSMEVKGNRLCRGLGVLPSMEVVREEGRCCM